MEGIHLTIEHKAGEQEQLFGSVTARNIADALAKQNYTVDHRKIQLSEPIKQLGEYKIPIKLHREVVVEVGLSVEPEGGRVVKPAETGVAEEAAAEPVEAEPAAEESAASEEGVESADADADAEEEEAEKEE